MFLRNWVVNKTLLVFIPLWYQLQTTNTAAFVMYQLAKHPEMQEEAHKEVLSVVGRDGAIDDTALQKMPYIKSCLKETMR